MNNSKSFAQIQANLIGAISDAIEHPNCPREISNSLLGLAVEWVNSYAEPDTPHDEACYLRRKLPSAFKRMAEESKD